jgi:hypothetical protein
MKLIDFNLNLASDKFQPALAFSTNKNSFLLMIKLKGTTQGNIKKIETVHMAIHNLDNDIVYNKIVSFTFDPDIDPKGPAFFVCMDISKTPNFKAIKNDIEDFELEIGKPNVIRFHLNYDCEGDNTIDYGDWPCNSVYII